METSRYVKTSASKSYELVVLFLIFSLGNFLPRRRNGSWILFLIYSVDAGTPLAVIRFPINRKLPTGQSVVFIKYGKCISSRKLSETLKISAFSFDVFFRIKYKVLLLTDIEIEKPPFLFSFTSFFACCETTLSAPHVCLLLSHIFESTEIGSSDAATPLNIKYFVPILKRRRSQLYFYLCANFNCIPMQHLKHKKMGNQC